MRDIQKDTRRIIRKNKQRNKKKTPKVTKKETNGMKYRTTYKEKKKKHTVDYIDRQKKINME